MHMGRVSGQAWLSLPNFSSNINPPRFLYFKKLYCTLCCLKRFYEDL